MEEWRANYHALRADGCASLKKSHHRGFDTHLNQVVEIQYPKAGKLFESEDLVEGARAIVEKRKPEWKGQ